MQIVLTVYASKWSELQLQIADIQYYTAKSFAVMGDSGTMLGLTCAGTQVVGFPVCSKSGVTMVYLVFFHIVPDMFNAVMLMQMCHRRG